MTVPENGIRFTLGTPDSTFTTAGMSGAGDSESYMESNATPVLTTTGSDWVWGRSPSVLDYWESGAPVGISVPRRAVLHWEGSVVDVSDWLDGTGEFWLGFCGSGSIKVVYDGGTVLNTTLSTEEIKYTSRLDGDVSDVVHIYYWQLGEAWGGVVGKYIPQPSAGITTPTTAMYRAAPLISTSLLPYEAADSAITLPDVTRAKVNVNGPNEATSMSFDIPLRTDSGAIGWTILNGPRRLYYESGATNYTLKRYQMIELQGGFQSELYKRFTGYINNFREKDGVVTVECLSFDTKLTTTHVENFPDRMSYLTFGYFKREATDEPVQDIPAYDGWPLEYAVQDLCYKSGVDAKRFYGVRQYESSGSLADREDFFTATKSKLFSATSWGQDLLKLQRQAKYGNSGLGFNERKEPDDEYIYAPDVSGSVADWVRTLTDGLGYDLRTNGDGDFVLSSRNNPHRVSEITAGSAAYSANAYGGFYQNIFAPFTSTNRVYAERIDLVVGRQSGLGEIDYYVKYGNGVNSGEIAATGTLDLALAGETNGIFLYDNRFATEGGNAAVTSLFSGDWGCYVVELSNSSGSQWWLDTLLLYDYDPEASKFLEVFKTNKAALSLITNSQATDARNRVVVVGKRKSAITDSAKFRNPNNPAYEYYVAVGADPASIWNPSNDNYVGTRLSTIISDDRIADQDYADWVAQTLLIRQRAPAPAPEFSHTLIPTVEPRDPIQVSDDQFSTITSAVNVWVVGFSEEYNTNSATSNIRATSYAEIPSFEPRQDIDLATLDSQFGGRPVAGVSIFYTSLDDAVITNPGPNLPQQYSEVVHGSYSVSSDGNGSYLNMSSEDVWPPMLESIYFVPVNQPYYSSTSRIMKLKNNPYLKFWHFYTGDYAAKKIHIPCLTGDGTTNYQRVGWGIGGSSVTIHYKGIDDSLGKAQIYSGNSPFYDPYSSELADSNLVTVEFDALVSGYYRISVWARDEAGGAPIRVAWLTEPGVDGDEPEAHWDYVQAGGNKQYLWDGVDNIGDWNELQSEDYAWAARGVFELAEKPAIGKGFYAWNNQNSALATISGQRLATTKLAFDDDHYSQFYVEIEVKNDMFSVTSEPIRSVRTDQLITTGGLNPQEEIYIYTYLPPPTQITISDVEDWDMSYGSWVEGDEDGWTSSPDLGATIRADKPIRLTFAAVDRPGELFTGNSDATSFKMHRTAHLNANIMDMFLIYEGRPWNADTDVERKKLVCRKLTNSEHTVDFADTDFRLGETLDTNKWIFVPEDVKINDQPLEFGDYLQLEDVPEYNRYRDLGGTHSRFLLGYINYIFYLSVYIQDRSGRMVWAIDDSFVDKGKLTTNTYTTEFPYNMDKYFNRTIFARQWNDPGYLTDLASKWSISAGNQKHIQFFWNRLEPNDTATSALRLTSGGGTVTGNLNTSYTDEWSDHTKDYNRLPSDFSVLRQFGNWVSNGTYNVDFLGDWTWEGDLTTPTAPYVNGDPLWIPAPTRDWHSYYLVPPMPLQTRYGNPVDDYWYTQVQVEGDKDCAVGDVWFSRSYGMNVDVAPIADPFIKRFWPGHTMEEWAEDKGSDTASNMFEYTRQNELMHWEHYRGMITGGPLQDDERARLIVQSTGEPYLMNWYRYDMFDYVKEISGSYTNWGNNIWAGNTEVAIADRPGTSISGWFASSFRHQYNWESANHFPVNNQTGRMHPEYLYSKFDPVPLPIWLSYDGGAWAGWKDDAESDVTTSLRWVSTGYGPLYGGEGYDNTNIFLMNNEAGFWAVGPETPERTNMMVSMVLLNNRRGQSVTL
jgi:hypothetical protein